MQTVALYLCYTVPLTKIITKSMFVHCSRSNHTFESIGSVSIISQSSISPISSFTCRSFNRLNHSYCFIDPFIPQKYEIEKRTKFTKVHKVSDAFFYSIYLFNKCNNFIYFDSSDWYVLGGNKFYFSCKTITEK